MSENNNPVWIITSLCLRDAACVDACPVSCIVGGKPEAKFPWFYIDPDTCIGCGACEPVCPYEAIFQEDEVPSAHVVKKDNVRQSMPEGTPGFDEPFGVKEGYGKSRRDVTLPATKVLPKGTVVDLKPDIEPNYDFYRKEGNPGYDALDM